MLAVAIHTASSVVSFLRVVEKVTPLVSWGCQRLSEIRGALSMCGIAGILRSSELAADNSHCSIVTKMLLSLGHRGPDGEGTFCAQNQRCYVAFCHTRLAIVDLTQAGRQPMVDERTGNAITFNGEIYNFQALRDELTETNTEWKSRTDTEVILRAYNRWGRACLDHLRGMFAFALWDHARGELFVARDRLGMKPLYYYRDKDTFLFASEVRTLLASGLVPRKLDPASLNEYLAYQSIPTPNTLIQDVKCLKPGTWLRIHQNGDFEEQTYWDLLGNACHDGRHSSELEIRKKTRDLLQESVALHLVADVPVAAFLSGGIDSSAIVALMREAGKKPETFSVIFAEREYDEAATARIVAQRFETEHHEILLSENSLLDQLHSALRAMDQPTGDGVNTFVVSAAVQSAGVKVALSGLGGDELFGGYPSFERLANLSGYLDIWRRLPQAARSALGSIAGSLTDKSIAMSKIATIMGGDGTIATAYPACREVLSESQRRQLFDCEYDSVLGLRSDPYTDVLRSALGKNAGFEMLSMVSFAEARTYMHDVLLRDSDQMGMAHALEIRIPFLDHKLVEYVMGLPDKVKRAGKQPKRLLSECMEDLLPRGIRRRPKQGFTLPFDLWMRGALKEFCESRLSPSRIADRGIFRPGYVQQLWRRFLEGHPTVSWSRLWLLVTLEEWLERNDVVCAL